MQVQQPFLPVIHPDVLSSHDQSQQDASLAAPRVRGQEPLLAALPPGADWEKLQQRASDLRTALDQAQQLQLGHEQQAGAPIII